MTNRIRRMRLGMGTLIASMLLWLVAALVAAPQAGRIERIEPESARPGDHVTIHGHGFGGRNVRVTVGGVPASIVRATGASATFVVPAALPGLTTVTARNPGGHSGSIPFKVLLDTRVDNGRATTAVIGPEGGLLETVAVGGTSYTLAIPPGAVDTETAITAAPVAAVTNLQLSGGLIAAVRLTPDGLTLSRPATLHIQLSHPADGPNALGFLVSDDGARFEVVRADASATTLTIEVPHFTVVGGATGVPADFVRDVGAMISTLPPTLPPSQVRTLIGTVLAWVDRYGFEICSGTDLCERAFAIAEQSLQFHQSQACLESAQRLGTGNPFEARLALVPVIQTASALLELSGLAASLPMPVQGFDATVDLACMDASLRAIAFLVETQVLAQPRSGLLTLLVDLAADAHRLGLAMTAQQIQGTLVGVLETLLARGRAQCADDPDAGEMLLRLPEQSLTVPVLQGLGHGLYSRFEYEHAACRIRIVPESPTVFVGQTLQFSGWAVGLSPDGVLWSLEGSIGSEIHPESGLFQAGPDADTLMIVATSLADSTKFRRAPLIVEAVRVTIAPASATVAPHATVQFSATVTGTPETGVTWAVTGSNVIDQTGRFTAGTIAGTYMVRATSTRVPSVFAEALVIIRVPPFNVRAFAKAGAQTTALFEGYDCQQNEQVSAPEPDSTTHPLPAGSLRPLSVRVSTSAACKGGVAAAEIAADPGPGDSVLITASVFAIGAVVPPPQPDFIQVSAHGTLWLQMDLPGPGTLSVDVHPEWTGAFGGNASVEIHGWPPTFSRDADLGRDETFVPIAPISITQAGSVFVRVRAGATCAVDETHAFCTRSSVGRLVTITFTP